jgi:membrane protease YdiL (CAAX protease family)
MIAPAIDDGIARRTQARRGLAVYLAGVILGSAICEGLLFRTGEPIEKHALIVMALMWTPGLASIVARLALREGFKDVSFSLRGSHGRRLLLLGWTWPLAVGLVAYGLAWTSGLDGFVPPKMSALGLEHVGGLTKLAISIGINLTLGTVVGSIFTAGEEIGWRGYMLTRLIDAGVPRPILVSGLIWAGWHMPLIVSGQYAAGPHPALSAVLFAFCVTGAAYVAARVRLESGSIWPAIAVHSSWNALIQGSFDRFTRGAGPGQGSTMWTGESGILVVIVAVVFALLFVARPWPVRRWPQEEPGSTISVKTA